MRADQYGNPCQALKRPRTHGWPTTWKCPKCRKRNDEGDTTCLKCGYDLAPTEGSIRC
jgi:hypothetical protein